MLCSKENLYQTYIEQTTIRAIRKKKIQHILFLPAWIYMLYLRMLIRVYSKNARYKTLKKIFENRLVVLIRGMFRKK